MELLKKIETDFKEAMKARDTARIDAIRLLKTAIKNLEIEKGTNAEEEDIITVISRMVKQRNEAIELYKKGNRTDLLEKEQKELELLQSYLPKQMTDEEIMEVVKNVIEETGASSPSDLGKVMGKVMPLLKGKADGKKVNQIVRNLLS